MYHNRKLKPFVIPVLYSVAFLAFLISLFFLRKALNSPVFDEEDDEYIYVTKSIFDDDIPVIGSDKNFIRPYTDSSIKIIKDFYDKDDDVSKQKDSIIYYENTYMQNSGIDYGGKDNFDVVAVLGGTVINVNEDKLLGKIIEIRHSNELISSYQSLSEVTIKKGDTVEQGQIIGKSGTCNVSSAMKDHLHFEILYSGKLVDPETVYEKTIEEL